MQRVRFVNFKNVEQRYLLNLFFIQEHLTQIKKKVTAMEKDTAMTNIGLGSTLIKIPTIKIL
jgi:hypothetical protein